MMRTVRTSVEYEHEARRVNHVQFDTKAKPGWGAVQCVATINKRSNCHQKQPIKTCACTGAHGHI